ncbi:phosphopantetheine-binding protein [Streptomyces massasporeus]
MRRRGISALTADQALRLLDAALSRSEPHLVPVKLSLGALQRGLDRGDKTPALLRGLLRGRLRRAQGATAPVTLRDRLRSSSAKERRRTVLETVRREAAVVLGLPGPEAVDAHQVFKEVGLDSLMAVELRRRLSAETGLTLPATLAFDHPTPDAMGAFLLDQLPQDDVPESPARRARTGPLTEVQIDSLVELLRSATPKQLEAQGLASVFLDLKEGLAKTVTTAEAAPAELDADSTEDLLQFLDDKFGVSS